MATGSKRERQAAVRDARARRARQVARRARVRSSAIVVGVVVVAGVLGMWLLSGASGGVAYAGDIRAGGTLEHLELPMLQGEGTIDYASMSEEPLVINFFASWCPNCIAEMPAFEQVFQELDGRVGFLGISQSDAVSASIELAQQTGITYPAGIDPNGVFFNAAGGRGMPTTIFVLPGGEIADVWVGGLDATTLSRLISEELGVTAA